MSNEPIERITGTRAVQISVGTIEVRELRWKDSLTLLGLLSKPMMDLMQVTKDPETGRVSLAIDTDEIPQTIVKTTDAVAFLLEKTTTLTPEQREEITLAEALSLIEASLDLNLNAEVLGKIKGIGAQVGATVTQAE